MAVRAEFGQMAVAAYFSCIDLIFMRGKPVLWMLIAVTGGA